MENDEEKKVIETEEVAIETVKEVNENTEKQAENIQQNNKKGLSITSMILGIVSIVWSFNFLISVACGVLAIIFGLKGKKMGGKGMAKAGFITGIIGLSLQVIMFLVGVMLGAAVISSIGTLI